MRRLLKCYRGIAALEFVLLAPALLTLIFGVFVYSLYFSASAGVKQAAAEGARAAVAGLSTAERTQIATARAGQVIKNYASVLGTSADPVITTEAGAGGNAGTFTVTVSQDMSESPIRKYVKFIPLPSEIVTASVTVTNGGY